MLCICIHGNSTIKGSQYSYESSDYTKICKTQRKLGVFGQQFYALEAVLDIQNITKQLPSISTTLLTP